METREPVKLTQKLITSLVYSKKQLSSGSWPKDITWDTEVNRFGVRVLPSEKKSYVIEYRINGRRRLKSIGSVSIITLTQARERAKRDLVAVIDGYDPLSSRDQLKKAISFNELLEEYATRHGRPRKKGWAKEENRIQNHIIPRFGNRPAITIQHNDVALMHSEIGRKHTENANKIVKLMSVIFNTGIKWGLLPQDFNNPCNGIDFFPSKERDRWITPEEMPHLIQAIEEEEVFARGLFWLYLLTGMRKSEIRLAKWNQVDFERKEFRLPETKNGKPHYLPLSNEAISVLKSTPKTNSDLIFPSPKTGKAFSDLKSHWTRIKRRSGISDIWVHDLRRTLGSWLVQSGNSLYLVGKILNHRDSRTTERYARFAQNNLREALDREGIKMTTSKESKK